MSPARLWIRASSWVLACLEKSDQRGLAPSPKSGCGGSAGDWSSEELSLVPIEDDATVLHQLVGSSCNSEKENKDTYRYPKMLRLPLSHLWCHQHT